MFRPMMFCMVVVTFFTATTFTVADGTKVVITVERPKPVEQEAAVPFSGQRPAVDVAILLDTSNSMDGLIKQAKSQLWTIVQQFAKAKKKGLTPVLRVALFEYGNTRLPASEGYIRQIVPLTDDLDKLSESLFALTTSGGDEYCGQVIDETITRLDWSQEPDGYKAIFIAGNEPFTQGKVDYRATCKRAIELGIVVNTIHCGNNSAGIAGKWQHGAQLAEGEFFNIDQDRVIVNIKCPQDEIIIRLSAKLNKTYLWCGTANERRRYAENQVAQDSNAREAGQGVAAARATTKASQMYRNLNRDLVDSLSEDSEILGKMKAEQLADVLKDMPLDERKAYVKKMAAERTEIQKKINTLAEDRETFLAKERLRLAEDTGKATLGDAVVSAIQKQLAESGFATTATNK